MDEEKQRNSFIIARSNEELITDTLLGNKIRKAFYWTADDKAEIYANKHDYEALRVISKTETPSIEELLDTCQRMRQADRVLFEQGMWVEYRSNDMKWKVGPVNRVVKQAPDDWDFDTLGAEVPEEQLRISYNVGVEGIVSESQIRAPTCGLKAIFGERPWLWLQFTLLQLEKRVRFDEDHEYDYDEMDFLEFATSRFEVWLEADENEDFRNHYENQSGITQHLLRKNLFSIFDFMNEIVDKWDFHDKNLSVYTYSGAMGSGLQTLFIVCMVQLVIPPILVYNNLITTDGDPSARFLVNDNFEAENGNFFPSTDFETFCNTGEEKFRPEGKLMLAMVIVIYLLDIVPNSIQNFYRNAGGHYTTYSKINSLIEIVWDKSNDRFGQEIGFKVDRMLNTGCLCTLYIVMLFVLLNTPIVVDLILNALAIDFIHNTDERIANSEGFDESKRWIRAGTVELIIQGQLECRVLKNAFSICKEYDIDETVYASALGGMLPLYSPSDARRDEADGSFMTKKELLFEHVAKQAAESNDKFVLGEYRKKVVPYGIIDYVYRFFGEKSGVFRRYADFRVWSRWERALFLPRVPKYIKTNPVKLNMILGKDDFQEFAEHLNQVLTFKSMFRNLRKAIQLGLYTRLPLKLCFGLTEWILYVTNLLFPFIVLVALFVLPACY